MAKAIEKVPPPPLRRASTCYRHMHPPLQAREVRAKNTGCEPKYPLPANAPTRDPLRMQRNVHGIFAAVAHVLQLARHAQRAKRRVDLRRGGESDGAVTCGGPGWGWWGWLPNARITPTNQALLPLPTPRPPALQHPAPTPTTARTPPRHAPPPASALQCGVPPPSRAPTPPATRCAAGPTGKARPAWHRSWPGRGRRASLHGGVQGVRCGVVWLVWCGTRECTGVGWHPCLLHCAVKQ